MDPALRQRLIGAAVLILLAVIFVPMLLDGPPPEIDTREVSLEIPPQPVETRRLPVEPVPVSSALGDRGDDPSAAVTDIVADSAGSGTVRPPPAATTPAVAPAAVTPAPVAPAASAPPTPVAVAPAAGRYVVRFGSFGDQANADRLVRRLKEKGVDASVEPVQAGERTLQRVVSAPLADRAAAEQLRLSVRKSIPEVSAQVAELDLSAPTASRVAQPVVSGWAVQVGVFSTSEAAEKLVADLRGVGHEGYFERMPSNGKVLYRVRVGPLARREDADRVVVDIKAKRKLDGLVVTYP